VLFMFGSGNSNIFCFTVAAQFQEDRVIMISDPIIKSRYF
jgi:hypothetical protein